MGPQLHPQSLLKFILNRFTSGSTLHTWLIEACNGTLQGPRREVNCYFMEVFSYFIVSFIYIAIVGLLFSIK